jgi:hypothetical protein
MHGVSRSTLARARGSLEPITIQSSDSFHIRLWVFKWLDNGCRGGGETHCRNLLQ